MHRIRIRVRRRPLAVSVLAALVVTLCATPSLGAPSTPVRIRKLDFAHFPRVTLLSSIQGGTEDVAVTENGQSVGDFTIESLAASGREVDVMLVIDTSGSMKGEPIASAVASALKFVTSLPDVVKVGIVTFSDDAEVVHEPTLDHPSVLGSLGDLKARGETALYDGIALAADAVVGGEAQHNVVLLSDGADTSSNASLAEAIRKAKKAHAAVFSVGLTSGEFDATALKQLAKQTGGRYSPVGTAELSRLYQGLATELSNQYVISYESKLTDGGQVTVAIANDLGRDGALALAPKLQDPARPLPKSRGSTPFFLLRYLEGEIGLLVAVGICFLAFFTLLVMLLGTSARRKRDKELVRRTAMSANEGSSETTDNSGWIPEPFIQAAETVGDIGGLTEKLDRRLERAGAPLRAGEFLLGIVGAAMAGAIIGSLLLDSIVFSLLVGLATATIPYLWLGLKTRRRMTALHEQLADILMILASSLRAGHSFFQALDMVSKEIGEPGATEFGRVVAEVRLGRPINEAMDALSERIGSDDFKWALLAVNIQREVGGNLAEVLDTVADTIRERDTIRRQIDVLTAEGRLSVAILTGLPIAVALYMTWVNPEYIGLLFNTGLGLLMTGVAGCLLAIGIVWMKKVVKIDV